ncbi:MAG TPA: FAD binding domain-containing protein [Candidatus Baltobacteraceae bacterium]|jgi:xanthine dehydrogenase YagS FAD-binding subunit|nr:FAD binding domain-containing protein [Candidatus Baltobacteraceae bacterium]
MKPFEYVTAQTPQSASELIGGSGRYIAGGIDILGELKDYLFETKRLVNIKSLPDTRAIKTGPQSWSIGANVTVAELAAHAEMRKTFPGLAEAAAEVASPQIRNVATLGGNLAQHSRCWYYRHRDVRCLKEGGSTCYAREGENKYHSLFSGNPCISPTPSNLAIALAALEATVAVQRSGKVVTLSIPSLYENAWSNPLAHNSLAPADLILRVEVPVRQTRSAYLQVSEKHDFDWALVSCSAAARVDGRKLSGARVVLGQVAPVPYRSDEADKFLEDKSLDDRVAAQAADLLLKGATPFEHNAYKVPLAHALIRRTLFKLIS